MRKDGSFDLSQKTLSNNDDKKKFDFFVVSDCSSYEILTDNSSASQSLLFGMMSFEVCSAVP